MEAPATPGLTGASEGRHRGGSRGPGDPRWTPLVGDIAKRELSARFASPFDEIGPSPLARRAAEALMDELEQGRVLAPALASALQAAGGGKMFGVLVVEDGQGNLGFLRAFSGTLDGLFEVQGFVPPLFDVAARAKVETVGEPVVTRLTERARAFECSPEVCEARENARALREAQAAESSRLRKRHDQQRRARRATRAELARLALAMPADAADRDTLERAAADRRHALDQQSRHDKAQKRELQEEHSRQREPVDAALRRVERRLRAHARLHRMVSRRLMQQIHDTYRIRSARGESRPLRELYAPAEPPGGAGDCAGPKLLAFALARHWRPLAMAEFWWGAPPTTGGRVTGGFYPACREKCRPLLPFMLEGIDVASPRRFSAPDLRSVDLHILYEDEWLVVVDKPCGLLSVPSRNGAPLDSVLERLARRHPGVTMVHRLDLDTSGVLLAALDGKSHVALQRQFLKRTVDKRYVGVVEGRPDGDEGEIDLPIRVDVHDRPRQIYDPVHGRRALTRWTVLGPWARSQGRLQTRVAFSPVTGRTHQIRVHAAHPLGLGTPIVGDRLYGHDNLRLLLHSEALEFVHPATGKAVRFESPVPF